MKKPVLLSSQRFEYDSKGPAGASGEWHLFSSQRWDETAIVPFVPEDIFGLNRKRFIDTERRTLAGRFEGP